jgi:hypothetical protein
MKLTKGNHAFVCCTHTDKKHIHTHVAINSTNLDCTKKFRNFKNSTYAVRRIADYLCLENGLSIVENPKPSKGKSYGKWLGDTKLPSNREMLEQMMDAALEKSKDYDGFIAAMIAAGCEVKKRGETISFKIPGAVRFARWDSLGDDYTEEAIRERLAGLRKVEPRRTAAAPDVVFVPFVITGQTKFTLLIDIQKKIQEGKGEAYEQWARIYNLKQAAKTLIYLKEVGIDSYDELVGRASAASSEFNSRVKRINEISERQKNITELQKQIGTYSKTRDVYTQYVKSGRSEKFYEEHRADLTLHQAAKNHFDKLGYGKSKPLPKIDALKQEWAMLEAERKNLYRGYKELKEQRTELVTAKGNCERLLDINRKAPARNAARGQNPHVI